MITAALDIICVVLMIYFASGTWSAPGRRMRALTERDLQKAEQWRAESECRLPHEDPLLVSLDIAFRDGLGAEPVVTDKEHLPPEDQKA